MAKSNFKQGNKNVYLSQPVQFFSPLIPSTPARLRRDSLLIPADFSSKRMSYVSSFPFTSAQTLCVSLCAPGVHLYVALLFFFISGPAVLTVSAFFAFIMPILCSPKQHLFSCLKLHSKNLDFTLWEISAFHTVGVSLIIYRQKMYHISR